MMTTTKTTIDLTSFCSCASGKRNQERIPCKPFLWLCGGISPGQVGEYLLAKDSMEKIEMCCQKYM